MNYTNSSPWYSPWKRRNEAKAKNNSKLIFLILAYLINEMKSLYITNRSGSNFAFNTFGFLHKIILVKRRQNNVQKISF